MSIKNVEDAYSLSPMQQGMLFHSLYAPASGIYVEQVSATIEGKLNVLAFEQAWQQVINRHPCLRTAFAWENLKNPLQVVGRSVQLPLVIHDWQSITAAEQQQKIQELLQTEISCGFELSKAPLMRLILIQLSKTSYEFIWTHHHILLDGWSTSLLLNEVFAIYEATCQNQTLNLPKPRPYRDYIAWLQQQSLAKAETFWRENLKGFSAATPFNIDKISSSVNRSSLRPLEATKNNNEDITKTVQNKQFITLSTATTKALQALARQYQLTVNTLVQGAWTILLSRYSGENDIVFGTTVSGRPTNLNGSDTMVGLFINTLPVRVKIAPTESLLTWLQQLQNQQVEARQYEYTPLVQIQQWSEVTPGTPLFESIVVFENYPLDPEMEKGRGDLAIRKVQVVEQTNYPLTLVVRPGTELELNILYDRDRFEQDAIARMLTHLQTLLTGMVAHPEACLQELSLLTPAEKHQLLVEWNQTQVDYPQDRCLHQLIEQQVEKIPDAVAVRFENQQLTYRELNHRANQLAHYLQQLGVKPDTLVGICTERSLEMVIGLLAILKAGGAYVPLDPGYPQQRLAYMLADTQVSILLTQQPLVSTLPTTSAKVICLDTDWTTLASQSQENPSSEVKSNNIAYVIYTSGSTGQPKGVMNTHQGLCNRLLWMQDELQLTTSDKVLQKTPFSFDVSVWEFFWPLIVGARLVVAQPGGHQDSAYLVRLIVSEGITTLHFVPSMLQVFLTERNLSECNSIKRVICSGEALTAELQAQFFTQMDTELYNLYGPTEAAIDVSCWRCVKDSEARLVPIGRPIANTQLYILDRQLQPLPIGVPGELHIGGVGLATGYLNRPELTAEKFIPNPFICEQGIGNREQGTEEVEDKKRDKGDKVDKEEENSIRQTPKLFTSQQSTVTSHQSTINSQQSPKIYKTGDLARFLPDGNIEYLGRIDHQVKIRGFRIELGEIEAVLQQVSGVQQAVVVVREDNVNDKRLVAYIVADSQDANFTSLLESGTAPTQYLRQFLQQQLPEYMVPSAFVFLDNLPLTPNGKLDRRALPAPEISSTLNNQDATPKTPIEKKLAEIWCEVLGLQQVGIYNNFFELGGHSLLATQVISKIRQAFEIELPIRRLFEVPTIAGLSQEIVNAQKQKATIPIIVPQRIAREKHRVKLSSLQQETSEAETRTQNSEVRIQ